MLSVANKPVMLSVVMIIVVMLNVVAPHFHPCLIFADKAVCGLPERSPIHDSTLRVDFSLTCKY
jgi:hypothetical protein